MYEYNKNINKNVFIINSNSQWNAIFDIFNRIYFK